MPAVSIILPLHNKGDYLATTLASLQAQRLPKWEVIIVENGSTDTGPKVAAEMAAQDERIHLILAPMEVCGPCGARNIGIDLAKGDWLLFLDADDWIEPDHLHCLVTAGCAQGADVVSSGWKEFIEGADEAAVLRDGPVNGSTASTVLDSCIAFAPWAIHAALVKREWLKNEHCWPMEMERLPSEDSVFWFRILHGAKLATAPSHSAIYRKETPGNRDAHHDLRLWVKAILRVISLNEEFLHNRGLRPTPKQAAHVTRSLESLWGRCREAGVAGEADLVEREAIRWLKMTAMEPGMLLRRVVGIRGFNALRHRMRGPRQPR